MARLFRLLRNTQGADRSHSLGPIAAAGRSLASMENTTASPSGTGRKWGLRVGCKEHGRQRPRSLVSRPQQSSLYWTLKCILQIARPAILIPIVLAQLLEPPCTDPYARWCGRGGAARLPPIPINPKTQENQHLPTAFLHNRILAHVKSQRRINRFRILHGRQIIDETGEVLTPTRCSQAWRASPKVGPT